MPINLRYFSPSLHPAETCVRPMIFTTLADTRAQESGRRTEPDFPHMFHNNTPTPLILWSDPPLSDPSQLLQRNTGHTYGTGGQEDAYGPDLSTYGDQVTGAPPNATPETLLAEGRMGNRHWNICFHLESEREKP